MDRRGYHNQNRLDMGKGDLGILCVLLLGELDFPYNTEYTPHIL
ncbi:hypothetical protein N170310_162 [Synechococcus phage S-CAM1]|uniref:Uncharacterized protein n=1 Tax=Synechococcus phage S-CAM1 TaxID=754037 RepID=A0A1D8KG92_9CAUD|nr:hypothetical protein N170310_162 [Synechococcus phage S-CAM1]